MRFSFILLENMLGTFLGNLGTCGVFVCFCGFEFRNFRVLSIFLVPFSCFNVFRNFSRVPKLACGRAQGGVEMGR